VLPEKQDIRFCMTADGVRIAYASAGSGPPLVKTANWLNHLEFDWHSPVWCHLLGALTHDFRVIRYDERGNGLSDWKVEDFSIDALVRDLETVVDAAGLERFPLLGISQGCAVSICYAVRHPERVTCMVLHGGYARGWRARGNPAEIARREAMQTLVREGWGQDNPAFRQIFTSWYIPDGSPEQWRWWNDLQRISTSPENAARLMVALGDIDVSELLPQVAVPTLVLHSVHDAAVPFAAGRELAGSIPGARFVPLESRNHVILEQESAWPRFLEETRSFLHTIDIEALRRSAE
jgi:pimeloyl-ACP methyl ester carboxylesterase